MLPHPRMLPSVDGVASSKCSPRDPSPTAPPMPYGSWRIRRRIALGSPRPARVLCGPAFTADGLTTVHPHRVSKPVSDDRKSPSGRHQPPRRGSWRVTRRAVAQRRRRASALTRQGPRRSQPRDPGSTALFHVGEGLHDRQLAEHHRCRLFPAPVLDPPLHGAQKAVRVLARMRRLEALEQLVAGAPRRGFEPGMQLFRDLDQRIRPPPLALRFRGRPGRRPRFSFRPAVRRPARNCSSGGTVASAGSATGLSAMSTTRC